VQSFSKGSLKVDIKKGYEDSVKDVATRLYEDLTTEDKKLKVNLAPDTIALLQTFLLECGVELFNN